MTFLRKSSLTLLSRAGILVLSFFLQVWISRALGPGGKGAYSVFTLIPALIAQLASLGIYNAYIFFIGQKRTDFKPAAENALTFSLAASVVLVAAYWLARPAIDPLLFKGIAPEITAWFAIALPLSNFFLAFNYLALAQDDISSYNLPNFARPLYSLAGLALLALWHQINLLSVTLVWVGASLILAVQAWWLIFRRERFGLGWHPALFRESLKFGWQSHLGTIFYYLGWRLDFLLCNIYLDARAVGHYSIAALVGEVLWFIPNTLSVVLLPQTTRLDQEQSVTLASQVCRLTIFSAIIGAIVIAVAAPFVVPAVFGDDFLPAVIPLWLVLPGMVFESGTRILTSFFVGRGLPLTTSISAGLVAGSNLLLNLWCIPRYGIRGAAIVGTVSYTLGAVYLLWAFRRITGLSYVQTLLPQRSDVELLRQIYSRFKNTFAHEQPSA